MHYCFAILVIVRYNKRCDYLLIIVQLNCINYYNLNILSITRRKNYLMKKIVLLVARGLLTGQSTYAEETTWRYLQRRCSSSEMGLPELSDSINEGGTAQKRWRQLGPPKVKVSSEANFSLGGMTWQKVKEDNSKLILG